MTAARTPTKAQIRAAAADARFLAALQARDNPNHTWSDDAACRGRDPELFFPDPAASATYQLSICAGCDVSAWCLAEALATNASHGVRNTTEKERRPMSWAWSQAVHPAAPVTPVEPVVDPCPEGHEQRPDSNGRPYCPTCRSELGRQGNAKRWSVAS